MHCPISMALTPRIALALVAIASLAPAGAQAQVQTRAAEVLRASGTVEVQRGSTSPWTPVRNGQELRRGDTLRTHSVSVALLTFVNAAQWQLSAESQLNLEEALAGGNQAIAVRLDRGRAVSRWTPDRRTGGATMQVRTPAGRATITGTEYAISVDESGRTAVLVLDGSVELANDRGTVIAHENETAEIRAVGGPPTLSRVLNAADRVQWLAAYVPAPLRYAANASTDVQAIVQHAESDYAAGHTEAAIQTLDEAAQTRNDPAIWLAWADLCLGAGDFTDAKSLAAAGRALFPGDARFDALLARIALFEGRADDSKAAAESAIKTDAKAVDGWLALGEWATREGHAPVARSAFTQATTIASSDARGWFGLGHVATEREEFRVARPLLDKALTLDPNGPGYRGELGTLETLANNLTAASSEYATALRDHPNDYVALTGRALVALKTGHEAEAVELLLRATLLESRYARAHLYLAVAYYRLARVDDARRELKRTSAADPNDPLPYLMLTQIDTDAYQPWAAIDAARAAQARMPFLKSLNQVATTPKGSANLGNAMAFFGIEDWAQHLAQESYYPYWAGSHLFLGDRYGGQYSKASEYFQGLLDDPTVLGGGSRFQTLLARPGTYLTIPFMAAHDRFDGLQVQSRTAQPEVSLNGYDNAWRPVAYAVNLQTTPASSGSTTHATTSSWAGSIGIRPTPEWSMFTVLSSYTSDYTTTGLRLGATSTRLDAGAQYRVSPTSTLSVKAGTGNVHFSAESPEKLPLTTSSVSHDVKINHAFSVGDRHQLSWGLEIANLPSTLGGVPVNLEIEGQKIPGLSFNGLIADRSEVAYASERLIAGSHLQFDAEIVVTAVREQFTGTVLLFATPLASFPIPVLSPSVRPQPRVGMVIRLAPGRLLRVAYQATTSALGSQDTLGPVATAGIPVDEILDNQFGDIFRYRAQLEWQWSARTFTRGFVEHKQFGSLTSIRDPFVSNVTDYFAREPLSRLRNQLRDVSQLNVASPPLLENTIATGAGSDVWLAGLTLNQMLSRQVSLASQYYWTRSATHPATGASTRMLFYPDRAFSVGATWISPHHVYASASLMYRSDRLGLKDTARVGLRSLAASDETVASSSTLLAADWTGQMAASWETPSKHWSIEMLATDLFASAPLHDVVRQPAVSVTVKYRR
jgi:tetratricopeptide (TPR) repeat protein